MKRYRMHASVHGKLNSLARRSAACSNRVSRRVAEGHVESAERIAKPLCINRGRVAQQDDDVESLLQLCGASRRNQRKAQRTEKGSKIPSRSEDQLEQS
jgi:hypothetical protein